ncbi:MAG: phosphoribosylformylglycinamidine synthase subunit PurS [Alphaproteobacteria bacterium]|nr:phosphoribosylformylglycinamidine synthase subunit PurS [Alphaproteobacteria bacterium]
MRVRVTVMPKAGVLDPQGKAIQQALGSLGFDAIHDVRAGKVILLDIAETDATAEDMARKLLANTVIESFTVDIP